MSDDWRDKPAWSELVALAFGAAARIAVRFGLSADQAARLMRSAWFVVQDRKDDDMTPEERKTWEYDGDLAGTIDEIEKLRSENARLKVLLEDMAADLEAARRSPN